jgi:cobalamin biosynthesis protein CobD/CbiB
VIAGGFALSAFSFAASVAESTATTVTGSIAGPLTTGGVAGWASFAAQPAINTMAASHGALHLSVYMIL